MPFAARTLSTTWVGDSPHGEKTRRRDKGLLRSLPSGFFRCRRHVFSVVVSMVRAVKSRLAVRVDGTDDFRVSAVPAGCRTKMLRTIDEGRDDAAGNNDGNHVRGRVLAVPLAIFPPVLTKQGPDVGRPARVQPSLAVFRQDALRLLVVFAEDGTRLPVVFRHLVTAIDCTFSNHVHLQ